MARYSPSPHQGPACCHTRGCAELGEQHLALAHPSLPRLPDRAFTHTHSLLFNLLLVPGKNSVIWQPLALGSFFSWLLAGGWLPAVGVLALQHDTATAMKSWFMNMKHHWHQGSSSSHQRLLSTLPASKSSTTHFKCFNFMHAFHYKPWPEAFLDKPSNQTILHHLLKSNFVLCQHKQFNLMFSLLSKHCVPFKSLLQGGTPLSIQTDQHTKIKLNFQPPFLFNFQKLIGHTHLPWFNKPPLKHLR